MKFKEWLMTEWKDIFGLDRVQDYKRTLITDNAPPIKVIKMAEVMTRLGERLLGPKKVYQKNISELQWGESDGAMKAVLGPYGFIKIILRKMTHDLEGNPRWICEKVIPVPEKYVDKEPTLIEEIYQELVAIDQKMISSPKNEYDLEKLASKVSYKAQMNMPIWFIYEGIRKLNDNNYLIYFSCKGQGAGKLQILNRLVEYIIDLSYDNKTGLIKSVGRAIETKLRGHNWQLGAADWIEYFTPTQTTELITENIVTLLKGF